jgi:hypothetical protein
MKPGQDCLGCHGNFAAAGTVKSATGGISNLAVAITVGGVVQPTTTNSVGNFYVGGSGLVSAATIGGRTMAAAGISGHCNGCHSGGIALP